MPMNTFICKRLCETLVCERRPSFEDYVLVPLTPLSLLIVPLVRLIENVQRDNGYLASGELLSSQAYPSLLSTCPQV